MLRSRPSFGDLLDAEEKSELDLWVESTNGLWRKDLEKFGPGFVDYVDIPNRQAVGLVAAKLYRNSYLAWCGVVELAPDHPWYGKRLSQIERELDRMLDTVERISTTPSSSPRGATPHDNSSHVRIKRPHGGLSDGVSLGKAHLVGFDCNHRGDAVPYASFVQEKNEAMRRKAAGGGVDAAMEAGDEDSSDDVENIFMGKNGAASTDDREPAYKKQTHWLQATMEDSDDAGAEVNPQLVQAAKDFDVDFSTSSLPTSSGGGLAMPQTGTINVIPQTGMPQMGLPPQAQTGNMPQTGLPQISATKAATAKSIPQMGLPSAMMAQQVQAQSNSAVGKLFNPGALDTDWTPVLLTNGVYRDHAFAWKELQNLVQICVQARTFDEFRGT
ncbi:unnamed protein product [Amoebophrya sp. A120]|nr:unnamed protein product [Amoebophrya sp. A120]|eukprot:GSA120T00017227001.1